jgi:8-oxo-dGTP pyrophosphatase MutT (NUDIX family)
MAAASSSSADNAGAIIFIKGDDGNIYILIGLETKYISDDMTSVFDSSRNIKYDLEVMKMPKKNARGEDVDATQSKIDSKKIFTDRAKRIQEYLKSKGDERRVLYDTPKLIREGEDYYIYKVNYRYVRENSGWGIPKGGLEESDGGSLKTCIIRELDEETKLLITPTMRPNLKFIGDVTLGGKKTALYTYTIREKDFVKLKEMFIERKNERHSGEFADMIMYEYDKIGSRELIDGFKINGRTLAIMDTASVKAEADRVKREISEGKKRKTRSNRGKKRKSFSRRVRRI